MLAIFSAITSGILWPHLAENTEPLIEPLLIVLLYQTFLGVPFDTMRRSLKEREFLKRLLTGNFLIAPAVVWVLVTIFLQDAHPAIVIGFIVVLVCPCVDYVLVFSDIAGGDVPRLTAATPVLMAMQMLLLPVYLWAFTGVAVFQEFSMAPFARAFLLLIALPLALAWLTQFLAQPRDHAAPQTAPGTASETAPRNPVAAWVLTQLPAFMVPVMMATLFAVICSYVDKVQIHRASLLQVAALYLLFVCIMMALMLPLSRGVAASQRISLIFSTATRNSLAVLPLVMALPATYTLAVPTVLTQTLVELGCMMILMALLPRIFASKAN